jgi:hypothetical protein
MTEPTSWPIGHRPVSAPARQTRRSDAAPAAARERAAIPLTVWPCRPRARHCHRTAPRPRHGIAPVGELGPELVARIVLAYSRPGNLVVLGSAPSLPAPAIEGLQRRCVGLTAALAHGAPADLVLTTTLTCSLSHAEARVADECSVARRVLRPGGLLVTVTRPVSFVGRGAVGCRPSDVVRAAQRAGFGYLQHNVAVHAPITDGLSPRPAWCPPLGTAARGLPMHCVVHSDVLVFTARESADG